VLPGASRPGRSILSRTGLDDAQRSTLTRADAILGAFDEAHPTMSLAGIMARTGLPKTTVHRAAEKMAALGWLERDGDRYSIGNRLFELATLSRLRIGLREAALPYMQDLYEATHETVHLAVRENDHVRYAEKISGHRPVTDLSRVGGRMPAHCTAVGKVLLAFAPPDVVEKTIANGLAVLTPATIVVPSKLHRELDRVRADGLGYDREESQVGMVCVAAPVFGPDGACVAAISITGPIPALRVDRAAAAVRAAALGVTRALRHLAGGRRR
jgi:DNA-binding IclR family transcriptional regulator